MRDKSGFKKRFHQNLNQEVQIPPALILIENFAHNWNFVDDQKYFSVHSALIKHTIQITKHIYPHTISSLGHNADYPLSVLREGHMPEV